MGPLSQLLPRPSYWWEDFLSWLDPVFQARAHMYPSQGILASCVILKILQSKQWKDQPGDLMELLSLALEVDDSLSLLLCRCTFLKSDFLHVVLGTKKGKAA